MCRVFNTTGACIPSRHYMVNLNARLAKIKELVDNGDYFVINRARQYGKTTTLRALKEYLKNTYNVISLDFQMISFASLETETEFVNVLAEAFYEELEAFAAIPEAIKHSISQFYADNSKKQYLYNFFKALSKLCAQSDKPIVLMIDEVDNASNSQVFTDFLAQLRAYYLVRDARPTFQSVILAGVYDIKNIRVKMRPDEAHKINSPWNIATDFNISMSFDTNDIAGMLCAYQNDHHISMDITQISQKIYDYTAGYPFLVSRICKLMDEALPNTGIWNKESAWSCAGVVEAVKLIVNESNTLFDSLMGKVINNETLSKMLEEILFDGKTIAYNTDNHIMNLLTMYGFIYNKQGVVAISNRIFEMRLYNYFLSTPKAQSNKLLMLLLRIKTNL